MPLFMNFRTTEKAFESNLRAGFHHTINNILPFLTYKYITGNLAIETLIMLEKEKYNTKLHKEQ